MQSSMVSLGGLMHRKTTSGTAWCRAVQGRHGTTRLSGSALRVRRASTGGMGPPSLGPVQRHMSHGIADGVHFRETHVTLTSYGGPLANSPPLFVVDFPHYCRL